ncbi:MAG: hypothetical protein AAF298_09725 [Cyanobacteria bacterium P01_A01_bin.40]
MIKIKENNQDKFVIRQYPVKYWLAFSFLFILSLIFCCHIVFQAPISSSLTCTKSLFNTNNCELIESALLNKNLTHKSIKNIHHPQKTFARKNNPIYLKIDYKYLTKIYYPSGWIIDPFLYRTNKQVAREITQLNNFINSWDSNQKIVINRKVPPVFHIVIWLLLLYPLLPVIIVFIYPVTTYYFDADENTLTVEENILFSRNRESYVLSKLKITSLVKHREVLILLKLDKQKNYTFNDFIDADEASKFFNLLKKFIPSETQNS